MMTRTSMEDIHTSPEFLQNTGIRAPGWRQISNYRQRGLLLLRCSKGNRLFARHRFYLLNVNYAMC